MTAAQLRWWTVPRLNSHSNPSSTGESSTAKTKFYLSFELPPNSNSRFFVIPIDQGIILDYY